MKHADEKSFSRLYETHVNGLYNYGTGLGFSHDTCLDAIHDVYCKLILYQKLSDIENIKYYLFRSFKNRLLDMRKRTKKEDQREDISELPFQIEVNVLDSIVEEEERKALKTKVEALMNLLTQRQREAIYLRYMEEMEYEEIGKLLNMTTESVRKLVFRAIEKLRKETGSIPLLLLLHAFYGHY